MPNSILRLIIVRKKISRGQELSMDKMDERKSSEERERGIVRVSLVGIAVNVVLAGFKFFVGVMANSIAITIDALDNASDVLSSVITVAGLELTRTVR